MPITKPFATGDIVEHEKYGKGIILGNEITREVYNRNMNFYHIYYFRNKTFGYAHRLTLIQTATPETKLQAEEILLSTLENNKNRFQYGDVVDHPTFGPGLIMGNGHKRAGRIYYHVYYQKTQNFGYNATFALIHEATDATKQKVRELLFKTILQPDNKGDTSWEKLKI